MSIYMVPCCPVCGVPLDRPCKRLGKLDRRQRPHAERLLLVAKMRAEAECSNDQRRPTEQTWHEQAAERLARVMGWDHTQEPQADAGLMWDAADEIERLRNHTQ